MGWVNELVGLQHPGIKSPLHLYGKTGENFPPKWNSTFFHKKPAFFHTIVRTMSPPERKALFRDYMEKS